MREKDCVIQMFFNCAAPTEQEVKNFMDDYWYPVGANFIYQHSVPVAEKVVRIAIEQDSQYAVESLQIAINNLMASGGLKVVHESGSMDPKTIEWLAITLRSAHAGESLLLAEIE